eukprot:SAG11_NODE_5396_length_1573_cov_1.499322_1_plen_294_part_00
MAPNWRPLLRAILNSPARDSPPARWLLLLPACLVAKKLLFKKKKKKKKTEQAVTDAAGGGDDGSPKKKSRKPDHIGEIWKVIWPKKLFGSGRAGKGSREMAFIFVSNLCRVYIANKLANIVRVGDGLLMTRDRAAFRTWLVENIILSVSRPVAALRTRKSLMQYSMVRINTAARTHFDCPGSDVRESFAARVRMRAQICSRVLEQTTNFVRDRLARIWREKLTDILHEEYFANSAYYHVEQKMQDADSRITEDARLLSDGFTRFFTAGIYTATTGVFYAFKLYWEFGFGYMAA